MWCVYICGVLIFEYDSCRHLMRFGSLSDEHRFLGHPIDYFEHFRL